MNSGFFGIENFPKAEVAGAFQSQVCGSFLKKILLVHTFLLKWCFIRIYTKWVQFSSLSILHLLDLSPDARIFFSLLETITFPFIRCFFQYSFPNLLKVTVFFFHRCINFWFLYKAYIVLCKFILLFHLSVFLQLIF